MRLFSLERAKSNLEFRIFYINEIGQNLALWHRFEKKQYNIRQVLFRESKVKNFPKRDLFLRASHVQDIMRNRLIYHLPSRKKSPEQSWAVEWMNRCFTGILHMVCFFRFVHSTV
jgi:hypothetical protein